MAGLPLTQGYTINIVKNREEPAVIMLNSMGEGLVGEARSFFVTVPESRGLEEVTYLLGGEEEVVEDKSSLPGQFQEHEEVFLEDSGVCDSNDSALVCFTSVAREEVVVGQEEEQEPIISSRKEELSQKRKGSKASKVVGVHCDLCNSLLPTEEEALEHMRSDHHIVTFEGPFFKCDFCGLNVTDRVSHMKVAHYSPLAQAFRKRNGLYECLRCNHTSDQLTNIRNHVDARHRDSDKSYVCEECNSEYKTLNSMRAHRSRVHGRKRKLEKERRREERELGEEQTRHNKGVKGGSGVRQHYQPLQSSKGEEDT